MAKKERGTLSVILTYEDNELLRNYRYTQIMRTQNIEFCMIDVIDDAFNVFKNTINKTTSFPLFKIGIPGNASLANAHQTVLSIKHEDLEYLRKYRYNYILQTGNIAFTLNQAMMQVFEIFRQDLKSRDYELMNRPEIVRQAEIKRKRRGK